MPFKVAMTFSRFGRICLLALIPFAALICWFVLYVDHPMASLLRNGHAAQVNNIVPHISVAYIEDTLKKRDPFYGRIAGKIADTNLPDAICIGSKKGGTGMLMQFLSMNPNINALPGEAHFFDAEHRYRNGLEFYNAVLPRRIPGKVNIEKTPKYFVYHHAAPRIYAMNSSIKLIIIMRDPVKRIISDYDHESRLPQFTIENTQPLEQLVFTPSGELNVAYAPVVASMYDLHLERWYRYFSREQILVLDGEKFSKDPLPILRECEKFLGIPYIIDETMFVKGDKGYYCSKENGCPKGKGVNHKTYTEAFLNKLRRFYAPHVKRTFSLIGQEFDWETASYI